jgi:hypothetical protein
MPKSTIRFFIVLAGVCSSLLFGSAVSAQLHQDSEGGTVNDAGGNLYGDGNLNADASPSVNSDADRSVNADASPSVNSDADRSVNADASPSVNSDGDQR